MRNALVLLALVACKKAPESAVASAAATAPTGEGAAAVLAPAKTFSS